MNMAVSIINVSMAVSAILARSVVGSVSLLLKVYTAGVKSSIYIFDDSPPNVMIAHYLDL